jgi:hypothetical protein
MLSQEYAPSAGCANRNLSFGYAQLEGVQEFGYREAILLARIFVTFVSIATFAGYSPIVQSKSIRLSIANVTILE